MSIHLPAEQIRDQARVVEAPLRRNRGERVFDLHPAIHLALAGAYGSFVAILASAFMGPQMVVPGAILLITVVALFLTPALWARVVPDDGLRRQSWAEFLREGVDTITGRLTAGQALAQILTLPALILALGLAMVGIRAAL